MKIVGMLYGDRVSMEAGFYRHAYGLKTWEETRDNVVITTGYNHTIEIDGVQWLYLLITDDTINKIAAIQFDAIFSEVTDPDLKSYIVSRFRPGLNK